MLAVSDLVTDIVTFLPYALAVVGFYAFLRAFYHVKAPIRPHFLWPIIFTLVGAGVFMCWAHFKMAKMREFGDGHTLSVSNQVWIALSGYVIAWILFYISSFLFDRIWVMYKQRRRD